MNNNVLLTVTSLLTLLFASFHLPDDVLRGMEPGGTTNYTGVVIMAVWLYATLMLPGRRWAHVIILIGSIGGAGVPYLHMMGSGLVGPKVVNAGAGLCNVTVGQIEEARRITEIDSAADRGFARKLGFTYRFTAQIDP